MYTLLHSYVRMYVYTVKDLIHNVRNVHNMHVYICEHNAVMLVLIAIAAYVSYLAT